MKNLVLITLLFVLAFSMQSCGQGKETYWRIKGIHREDGEPFIGLTGMSMAEIVDYNFHFVKRNDSLHFEWPDKFVLDLNDFQELNQLQINGKDYYNKYDHGFEGNSFLVKFVDNATTSKSKKTIMEFERIDYVSYEEDLEELIAYQQAVSEKMDTFKQTLTKNSPAILHPMEELATKIDTIFDDTFDSDIVLRIPESILLYESGDLKNEKFGDLKIGTFKEQSKIYDIEHAEDYGLRQLTIWISTDPAPFNMEKYLAENDDIVLVKKDKNNIVGYRVSYDFEKDKPFVQSFITLKYLHVGKTHIFLYGDATASQMNGVQNFEEMNKILNFNCQISDNISVVHEQ